MKGEFFRPCPKCGKICSAELDMCEICSGKIAKPEQPKPIIPVVTPIAEPIVEEVAPVVEEQVATEEVIEEVATEENIVEETTNEEKQEEVVVPVIETKAPKGKGAKGLYALVAVLMLVIVALIVVIMQDKQPDVAVNNTTLQSNTTTSTTLAQETESTTEIITGTTAQNAGETLASVTTTKKAQNTNKETTTKKNTSSSTKETTTKKSTTTTTETGKIEFNPTVVYSKNKVYRDDYYSFDCNTQYYYDFKINKMYFKNDTFLHIELYIEVEILKLYEEIYDEDSGGLQIVEVERFDKLGIKERIYSPDLYAICYTENNEYWNKYQVSCYDTSYYKGSFKKGTKITLRTGEWFEEDDMKNIFKVVIENTY